VERINREKLDIYTIFCKQRVPEEDFLIFTDYPTTDVEVKKGKPVSFNIKGDPSLTCSLRIIPQSDKQLPDIKVTTGEKKIEVEGMPLLKDTLNLN
jgi:hypothetical protein